MQMPLIVPLIMIPLAFVVAGTMLIPVVRLNQFLGPFYGLEGLSGRGIGTLISSTAPVLVHKLSRVIEAQEHCWERLVCNSMQTGESADESEGYIFPYFRSLVTSKYWETPFTQRMHKFLHPTVERATNAACQQYSCSYLNVLSNFVY